MSFLEFKQVLFSLLHAGRNSGESFLHLLVQKGYTRGIELALSMRNFDDPVDAEGETILHEAAKYDQLEIVKEICNCPNNINLEKRDKSGETPLHKAVRYGHDEVVSYLIYRGADMHAKTSEGATPLHLAARYCRKEILEVKSFFPN